MPVGRYFRGLTTFDLLGNLVPGVVVLVAVYGVLPSLPFPKSIGGFGLVVVAAFSVGTFVQHHASFATGERRSFRLTMQSAERLDDLTKTTNRNSKRGITGQARLLLRNVTRAYLDPLFSPYRSERGTTLDDVILTNKIWDHLTETHDIPPSTDAIDVLYHLMSSKVDDLDSPSRAIRFQAHRNFNRGMWIGSWYVLVTLLLAWMADAYWAEGETIYSGVVYSQPAYFDYWTPIWHLVVVALAFVWGFWVLTESYEEDYVEYLFSDYAVAISENGSETTVPDELSVEVVHDWNDGDGTTDEEGGEE